MGSKDMRAVNVHFASPVIPLRFLWGVGTGALFAAICLAGCSRPAHIPELGEVAGQVTLDGQPLANATVTFAPPKGRPSLGTTDADGRFLLTFIGDFMGAMVGPHTVRISTEQYIEKPDGMTEYVKETLPPWYNAASELTAEVRPGLNEFVFDLSSAKRKKTP